MANIDTTGTLNDDAIAGMLAQFPAHAKPSFMVLNRDVLELLRKSRTATNATGAPAENPSSIFGVPVIVTDQIVSNETAV